MKRVSLADIAKSAGVSKSLVSLVMNDRGDSHGISKKTQKKVKAVADDLNYTPNTMARSLRTGKTDTIGLILADIGNPFYAKLARSIEDFAITKGYHLIFSSSDENAALEEQLIEMMRNRQVDGLIIASTLVENNCQILQKLHAQKFPFVLIDRYIPDTNFSSVVSDNEKGTINLVQHLIDQDRKKIALFTITPSHLTSISDRISGYKKALLNNKISIDRDLIIEIPFDNVSKLKDSFDLLERKKVDAIITLNNSLAHICLKTCQERGIRIPEDMAFSSFDDVVWFDLVNPGITGVRQPVEKMGEAAVQILMDKFKSNKTEEKQEFLPVELKIRKSSMGS